MRHDVLRQRVIDILEDDRKPAFNDSSEYPLVLDDGQLLIEDRPFSMSALLKWEQDHWQRAVWKARV